VQQDCLPTISSIYINAGGDEPLFDPSSNITWYPDSNYLKIDPPNQNNDNNSKSSLTTVYGNSTPFVYRNDNKCPDQVKMEDLILSLSSLLNGSHNQTVATELLCTERWFNEAEGTSRYTIPVPMNGHYQVVLYFTEIWFQNPKERVFDVYVQSVQYQLKNFDINKKEKQINGNVPTTASTYNPIVQVVAPSIWVTNGYITIDFIPKISNPKINAIVIHPILSTE
jgi:Malectin domain